MESTKARIPAGQALELAAFLMSEIGPGCERIQIAGSLRRRKPTVGDIELVCVPKLIQEPDLFGEPGPGRSLLDVYLRAYELIKNGQKYKRIQLGICCVDLFIQVDPATWGVNFTLRTGSEDFSHWLVTRRRHGGALPSHMAVKDGRLWAGSELLETPEEEDFFRAVGREYIPPEKRTEGRWVR